MNFPPAEFVARHSRLKDTLDEHGLDALFITSEANFNYVSGFCVEHPWVSFTRNLLALIPRHGPPALVIPASFGQSALEESWIQTIYPHAAIGFAPIDVIAQAFRDLDLHRARIGAELGYEQRLNMSYLDFVRLQSALPNVCFVDGSEALWRLRKVKSEAEISCLRRACEATAFAFETVFPAVRSGMTEEEIAQLMKAAMITAGAHRPGWVMITSGRGNYHRIFGWPRPRPISSGEMVWIDASAIVNGYGSDFDRAGVCGGPTAEQIAAQAAMYEATQAGIRTIRAGIRCSEVTGAVNEELEHRGLPRIEAGRIGHGLGLTSTEPPNLASDDTSLLEAGMVVTVEPALIREDGIYQIEENVVVREQGYELLTSSPPHLREINV